MFRGVAAGRGKRIWSFDDDERRVLLEATAGIPELLSVVTRATPRPDVGAVWIVDATVRELDDMYSLVESLIEATRGCRRRDLLEGLIATLCTAIDGF